MSDDHLLFGSDAEEQMNLYRCALDGSGVEKLTAYDRPVHAAVVGPHGERIAYSTNESETLENEDTYVADVDGSNSRRLPVGDGGTEVRPASFGPEGDRLLLYDNTEDTTRCGVYDLDADEVTWYGSDEYEEVAVAFRPDGSGFLARRIREAGVVPVLYDVEGGSYELDFPEGVASFPQSGDGVFRGMDSLVLSHASSDARKRLHRYDLETHE